MKFLRRYIVFVLLISFAFGLAYQTFTVAHFYLNRSEIAEKYCENKDKPEMKCHGKCHLTKKLNKRINITTKDLASQIEPISFWIFGVEIPKAILLDYFLADNKVRYGHVEISLGKFYGKLFIPPDLQSI